LKNPQESENPEEQEDVLNVSENFVGRNKPENDEYSNMSLAELHQLLGGAVSAEDYEKAAKIRDEISKRES
jgi:protein-arginine kinase activator protein McsA